MVNQEQQVYIPNEEATRQQLNELARRHGHPVLELFSYYSLDRTPSRESPERLWKKARFNELETWEFFMYEEIDNFSEISKHLENIEFGENETLVIQKAIDEHKRKKQEYAKSIIRTSPDIQRMVLLAQSLLMNGREGSESKRTIRMHTPYEAELRARQEMIFRYGDNFENYTVQNPQIKSDYADKRMRLLNQQAYGKDFIPNNTLEAEITLQKAISTAIPLWLEDFVTAGGKVYVTPEFLKNPDIQSLQETPVKITTENAKKIQIQYPDDVDTHDSNQKIYFSGQQTTILVPGVKSKYLEKTSPNFVRDATIAEYDDIHPSFNYTTLDKMIYAYIGQQSTLNQQKITDFYTFKAREYCLGRLRAAHFYFRLANDPSFEFKRDTYLAHAREQLINITQAIEYDPCLLLDDKLYNPDEKPTTATEIVDAIKWSNIVNAGNNKSFPDFPIDTRQAKNSRFRNFIHSFGTQSIAHESEPTNPNLPSLVDVLIRKLKLGFNPDFIIHGSPLKHKNVLKNLTELSTYPEGVEELFTKYSIQNDQNEEQIFINSRSSIAIGTEAQKQVVRLYTPEFATVTSLHMWANEQALQQRGDYCIEYESQTGHYRVILTKSGNEKTTNIKRVHYRIGIDPYKVHPNAPELVNSIPIEEVGALRDAAHKLDRSGHRKIAQNLAEAAQTHNDKPLTSQDISHAIHTGSRYAFASVTDGRSIYPSARTSYFPYLPPADSKGVSRMKCTHSASLLRDIVQEGIPNGFFYDANMFNTVYVGLGYAFAGLPHADTRGRVGDVRIRHDAVPHPTMESIKETFAKEKERKFELNEPLFMQLCDELSSTYIEGIEDSMRKNHYASETRIPRILTRTVTLIEEIRASSQHVYTDRDQREAMIQQLKKLQDTWSLAHTDLTTVQQKKAHEQLFGSHASKASLTISVLDGLIRLHESVK